MTQYECLFQILRGGVALDHRKETIEAPTIEEAKAKAAQFAEEKRRLIPTFFFAGIRPVSDEEAIIAKIKELRLLLIRVAGNEDERFLQRSDPRAIQAGAGCESAHWLRTTARNLKAIAEELGEYF